MNGWQRAGWVIGVVALGLGLARTGLAEKRPSDEERGRELYLRHCLPCHGTEAAGDGPAAAALVRPVPDLRDRLVEDNRDAFVQKVLAGSGAMPSYTLAFDKYDARRVVKHMERAARGEGDPAPEPEKPGAEGEPEAEGPDGGGGG